MKNVFFRAIREKVVVAGLLAVKRRLIPRKQGCQVDDLVRVEPRSWYGKIFATSIEFSSASSLPFESFDIEFWKNVSMGGEKNI